MITKELKIGAKYKVQLAELGIDPDLKGFHNSIVIYDRLVDGIYKFKWACGINEGAVSWYQNEFGIYGDDINSGNYLKFTPAICRKSKGLGIRKEEEWADLPF